MYAAIYLRLSQDEEKKGIELALENHRTTLIELAKKYNLKYDIYEEIGSGKDNTRPEMTALMNNIDDYDYVLVMDQDRLSRDSIQSNKIMNLLIMNDIKLLTPSGEINLSDESNEFLFQMKSNFAEYEWKQIRKRMARGRVASAKKGLWVHTNKVPLGYTKTPEKHLVINPEEAKIVRFIFDRILQGFSINQIAKDISTLGWTSRNGKMITTSHITTIRRNPTYYGCIHVKPKKLKRVVDEVFVEGAFEGIITKEEFIQVQKMMEGNDGTRFKTSKDNTRLLSGIIYCAQCGRKKYIQKDKNGRNWIKTCGSKISNNPCKDAGYPYEKVESLVIQKVKKLLPLLKNELLILDQSDTTNQEVELKKNIASFNIQLLKLEKRKRNYITMRADGEIDKFYLETLLQDVEKEANYLKREMYLTENQLNNLQNLESKLQNIQQMIETFNNLEHLPKAEANAFIKTFIKKVHFSRNINSKPDVTQRNDIEITLKIEAHDL